VLVFRDIRREEEEEKVKGSVSQGMRASCQLGARDKRRGPEPPRATRLEPEPIRTVEQDISPRFFRFLPALQLETEIKLKTMCARIGKQD